MKFLKDFFAFYINSSIHVSLAVVALLYVTAAEFHFLISENLALFVFFGSITGYNFVKYAGVAKLHHLSLAKWLKLIQIFSFLCFLLFVFFAFQLSFSTFLVAGLFGLFTLFYALPVFPKQKNLRSIAGIKIFIIAVVWAGVTVILPIFNAEMALNVEVWLEFFQRLLFVIAITLPFEIRDLKYDDSLLKTIPQNLGISKTKKMGYAILLFSLALEFFQNSEIKFVVVYGLIAALSAFLIFKSSINQHKYFASFLVEAVPIFWAMLLFISE